MTQIKYSSETYFPQGVRTASVVNLATSLPTSGSVIAKHITLSPFKQGPATYNKSTTNTQKKFMNDQESKYSIK
jgi:hypothetical protein